MISVPSARLAGVSREKGIRCGLYGPTFPCTYSVLRTNNKKPQETSGFGLIGGDVASLCLGASIGKVDGNPGGKWLPS